MNEVRDEVAKNVRGLDKAGAVLDETIADEIGESERNVISRPIITADVGERPGRERYSPLWELTLCRLRESLREPELVFWVFVFPVLLTCSLGIAFRNTAPEKNRVAVEIASPNDSGRAVELARSLSESPDIQATAMSPDEAARALRTGKIAVVIQPAKAAGDQNSSSADFEYKYDPTRPDSRTARLAVNDSLQRSFGRPEVVNVEDRKVSEPGGRYVDFLVPGLVGMNLMGSGLWGVGFAVVQARTRKILKRLAATPMRRSHFLLSFMFSRLAFLFFEVAAIVGFGWLVFSVAVHGRLVDLAIVSLAGSMTFAGLGMLVASRPRTVEGVSGLMN